MDVIIIMVIGVLFGSKVIPDRCKKIVEKIQFLSVILLIFIMGVSLGRTEGFVENIMELGFVSGVYAIVPIIFSVIFVYMLTKNWDDISSGEEVEEELL